MGFWIFCVLHLCFQSVETAPKLDSEKTGVCIGIYSVFKGRACRRGVTIYIYKSINIYLYIYVYIFAKATPPPQRPTFCVTLPPKTLFRAVFVVDVKQPPISPDCA